MLTVSYILMYKNECISNVTRIGSLIHMRRAPSKIVQLRGVCRQLFSKHLTYTCPLSTLMFVYTTKQKSVSFWGINDDPKLIEAPTSNSFRQTSETIGHCRCHSGMLTLLWPMFRGVCLNTVLRMKGAFEMISSAWTAFSTDNVKANMAYQRA